MPGPHTEPSIEASFERKTAWIDVREEAAAC